MIKAVALRVPKHAARGGLGRNVLAVALARVFSLVAAAIQVPALARFLPPAEYAVGAAAIAAGVYVSLLTAEAPALAFQRFPGGLDASPGFSYARRQYYGAMVAFTCLCVAVGAVLGEIFVALAISGWGAGLASMRLTS